MKALVAVLALCAVSCTVNRKSEQFTCVTSLDCKDGRTCDQGYCVTDGSGSDPACDAQCTSCDHTTTPPTCVIQGTGGASIDCPQNAPCKVLCTSSGACNQVTCNAPTCNIICSSPGACGSVSCGGGACDVTCSATNACPMVSCASACSCNVSCANKPACGALTCPMSSTGGFCTDTGTSGGACSSNPAGCNHC